MLRVRDIMTSDPITLDPDSTLRDAAERLTTAHISGAPVVNGEDVVGVLSLSDIVEFLAVTPGVPVDSQARNIDDLFDDEDETLSAFYSELGAGNVADVAERMRIVNRPEWDVLSEHTVSEIMTQMVFSLPPDASVETAAEFMGRAEVHRILALEAGRLVGILSSLDIAKAVADHRLTTRTYVFSRR